MSHVVTVRTRVRDPAALAAACRRLGLPEPAPGTAELFGGGRAAGLLVRRAGHSVAERGLADGSVRLTVTAGGFGLAGTDGPADPFGPAGPFGGFADGDGTGGAA